MLVVMGSTADEWFCPALLCLGADLRLGPRVTAATGPLRPCGVARVAENPRRTPLFAK